MHFDSLTDFLQMGGYAFYVWLSFGVTFACLIAVYWEQNWRISKLKTQVMLEHERAERIKKARQEKAAQKQSEQASA